MYDDYEKWNRDHDPDKGLIIFLFVCGLIVFMILMGFLTAGCASTQNIDWGRVIAAIQEYKDDIPIDKIQDALDKIKK